MSVRIGVDFGTAFTKVAIRARDDPIPVEWSAVTGDDSEMGRYVVPGFVVRAPDGEFCWRQLAKADIRTNLKLPVIEMGGTDECPVATVAYLALVIRYARAFLYRKEEIGQKLAGRKLRWELNIGCPTKPHEAHEVVHLFWRIARTAWQLAAQEALHETDITTAWKANETGMDPISESDAREQARKMDIGRMGLEREPCVVPEFVAQIAGYLGSTRVREGLHALIDIGAATLDAATFNVVLRHDLPCIPIFFSAVRPLGTHYLRHNRHSRLGLDLSWNDAAPVESADEFAKRNSKSLDEVYKVDKPFVEEIVRCIVNGVIDPTRKYRRGDPDSAAWREGILLIFITGGGSNCDLYRQAIEAVEKEMRSRVAQRSGFSKEFRFIELDPTFGKARHTKADNRLSVAFGLTEDADNIARIIPHREIEPIVRTEREPGDRDKLYEK